MLYFINDYSEGAHPKVIEALTKSNKEQLIGYGEDTYSKSAKEKIKKFINKDTDDIYFITGGTQTNLIVIGSMLKNYEGVIAATTGHVSGHEAGAIEHTGHKVLTVPSYEGKIKASDVKEYLETFYNDDNHSHMVYPGMVYISHPTEYGTLYSKKELEEISALCKDYKIPLFLDGARLGYALASESDVSVNDIANLTDVFYIGGTKVGALCGEAIVFTHNNAPKHFITLVKQYGALLAKGRLLSVQFDALFTNNLYVEISKNAIKQAMKIKETLIKKGYQIYIDSPTNQQFIVMENNKLKEFGEKVKYGFWEKYDNNHTVIRLATSWATTDKQVEKLIDIL